MPQDIRAFFESYRDAFNALNGRAVAELYAQPSGIAQGAVYTHWESRQSVEANMSALCKQYEEQGFVASQFELGQVIEQGEHHAVVDVRWRIDWNAGQQPWHFSTTYNLLRTSQGWRVLLCTAYTEAELSKAPSAA